MQNYKKGILALAVVSAMSLMAAEDKTIRVTTLADEDGENASECSLREAIKTAKLDKSYGGCNVGRTLRLDGSAPDQIQLKAGTYKIDRELVVESAIHIYGENVFNYTERSPITLLYPKKEALKTVIDAQGKSRIFNTVESQAALNIHHVSMRNGNAVKDSNIVNSGNGGALYVAGPLGIYSSEIIGSSADVNGGAIYAIGQNGQKTVSIDDSRIEKNKARQFGSVFAMDCNANLANAEVGLQVSNSSLIRNGSTSDQSIFDFCGYATGSFLNSTIAQNQTGGYVFNFVNRSNRALHSSSSLSLSSNTIVENTAKSVLLYDNIGAKLLSYNVLAYNQGKSCEYALNDGKPSLDQNILFAHVQNAFDLKGSSQCVLPERSKDQTEAQLIDLSSVSMSSVLSKFLEPAVDNRYLGIYYPRDNKTANDLVDVKGEGCEATDQRGISRDIGMTVRLSPDQVNSCEIGAVEIRNLMAGDVEDLKNSSHVELMDFYQSNIDELEELIEDQNTPKEELAGLKEELKEYQDLKSFTEKFQKYRAIYIDPFKQSTLQETLDGSSIVVTALNASNYNVTTKVLGVGVLVGEGSSLDVDGNKNDPALKCEWIAGLDRIMMYRTDGKVTSATDQEFCAYTLVNKNTNAKSSGVLAASFVNIAPIAKNDFYKISPDSGLTITVNPLENDSDEGDGDRSTAQGKPAFYKDTDGKEIPIRIVSLPSGVTLKAEREGPCPDDYQRETCYGGKLTFSVNNNLSQFSYSMDYNVFDADEMMSNTATIVLENTVKNTNTSSSGGGSLGVWGLFGLFGLAAYRSRRLFKS
ncbi:CSLREA domain-containing protein [Acinetobacter sp. LoGeW2-3]|uniref:CSLREA domain-containing protein n=1 Tax=Acinetobacter sp. LoGeW2-3 TaxID=1808001 RepID=UPI000C05983E|nr:CSLREA domain-containing protein [Acinetobacter sp. LoGeW2-3]ATO19908.1 CSLREA domain-containing protein [Acinetobacter sp. LoGeW2-3]